MATLGLNNRTVFQVLVTHGNFEGMTSFHPLSDRNRRNADLFSPLPQRHSLTIKFVEHVATCISGLFFRRRPSAVLRGVALLIVTAVNGQSRWPLAHVSEKVLKAIAPSVTDGDPAPTITRISFGFCAVAAVKHRSPYAVCRRLCLSMCAVPFRRAFSVEAST